jgi:hypothetical protein
MIPEASDSPFELLLPPTSAGFCDASLGTQTSEGLHTNR